MAMISMGKDRRGPFMIPVLSYFICSKKLNIQMNNGQTVYKNSLLTYISVAANPGSQITTSVAIGPT